MKKETRSWQFTDTLTITFILIVATIFRLYHLTAPLADYHSWRQVDTAAVSRNMARNGIDMLHPKYDDLSNIQSSFDNPEGYRFVEFPIFNAVNAALYNIAPFFAVEVWGRVLNILATLVMILVTYYLLIKEASRTAAVVGSIVFATFPFMVFFTRVVLPEPFAMGLTMVSILFLYWHTQETKSVKIALYFLLSLVCFSAAVLIKPTAIFYAFVLVYLFARRYQFALLGKVQFYLFFLISLAPFIWWRYYILSYPEGIPASSWLITSINTGNGLQPIFLKPAFFRWIFFERINNRILGGFAATLLMLGVLRRTKTYLFLAFLAASFSYIFTFEGGNVQHEYYQVLVFPTLAMFVGLGAETLIKQGKVFLNSYITTIAVVIILAGSWFFAYYQVMSYYDVARDRVQDAKIINTLTGQHDKVITDTLGDTTLLYLADRRGAPAVFKDLKELKAEGYKYFYTQKQDVAAEIKKEGNFTPVFENGSFTLFRL